MNRHIQPHDFSLLSDTFPPPAWKNTHRRYTFEMSLNFKDLAPLRLFAILLLYSNRFELIYHLSLRSTFFRLPTRTPFLSSSSSSSERSGERVRDVWKNRKEIEENFFLFSSEKAKKEEKLQVTSRRFLILSQVP